MARPGSDEYPVRTMGTRVVRSRLNSFGANRAVIRTMETPGLHHLKHLQEGRNLCRALSMHFLAANFCYKDGL